MKKNKVAFQGELGAYSHIAINELFENPEIKTCATFEETFKVAFENEDYKIVIPLENSLAGRVADIHYLLPKYKLQIHAEHFQKVEHNLLAKENTKLEAQQYTPSMTQRNDPQNLLDEPENDNDYTKSVPLPEDDDLDF